MSCFVSYLQRGPLHAVVVGLAALAGCAGTIDDPARFEGAIVCEGGCVEGEPFAPATGGTPGTTGKNDGAPSASLGDAARGKRVVEDMGCRACHGDDLEGEPAPGAWSPNLTPDPIAGLGDWTDADIGTALRKGKAKGGRELCGSMPTFSPTKLSDAALADLVAYLRVLPVVSTERKGSCP